MTEKVDLIPKRKPLHPRRCATCAHYDPPDAALRQDAGACVKKLPVAALIPGAGGQAAVLGFFPQMKPEQRCAEWEMQDPPALPPENEITY